MTTTESESTASSGHVRCGCCSAVVPAGRATELMNTPGVFICSGCALWATARLTPVARLYVGARRLARRVRPVARGSGRRPVIDSIPILRSSDLDRSCAYYVSLGFEVVERSEGYLVLHTDGVELHLATETAGPGPGDVFLHVTDAGALWKRLKAEGVTGLGPVEDQPWGLREFVAVDPDGNRIRLGSPPPHR